MVSEGVSLPLIHQHLMVPIHTLWFRASISHYCDICGKGIEGLLYRCEICDFVVDQFCAKYPPPEVIDISETHHHHKLTFLKKQSKFECGANCGKISYGFPYRCQECDLSFHSDCVWNPLKVIHKPEVNLFHDSVPPPLKHLKGQQQPLDNSGAQLFQSSSSSSFNIDSFIKNNEKNFSFDSFTVHIFLFFFYLLIFLFFSFAWIIDSGGVYILFFYLLLLTLFLAFLFLLRTLFLLLRTSIIESHGVSLPLFHHHPMIPWNDLRKGDCCGRFETLCDGYYCHHCDFFVHKKCGDESQESIEHPSHSGHTLWLQHGRCTCSLCGRIIIHRYYHCKICDFNVDIYCAKYPPPEVINISKTHHHKLNLLKKRIEFDCAAKCGKIVKEFPYICQECDLSFHVDCVWNPSEVNLPPEVNHSYHSLHPLKLLKGRPLDNSDGHCRLCNARNDGEPFYNCYSCNFTLNMRCVFHPPPQSLLDLKAHDHKLTLFRRLDSYTCNACGLKGDRSPYICVRCDFMIHQSCLALPRLININRHDHRISRTSVIGVGNSVCKVCRLEVVRTYGGYSCQKCQGYVVHSKCATRKDVWNGKELEGVPEETENIEPYVVMNHNTIQHFSHQKHYMRLNDDVVLCEENKRCSACTHPIFLQSFYGCISCDFFLHKICAGFPRKKWHVLHNERLTLYTSKTQLFVCVACSRMSNGFMYQHAGKKFDVLCGSISEPFVHPSHPHHPLYYTSPEGEKVCNGCNMWGWKMLRCIEIGCEYFLCFKCVTLPQVVKHRVDDYPLSLCYGEEASGKYWCDICEKETNPKTWFYTCKDQMASLHTECVLGDFLGLMPRSIIELWGITYEVVLNNSVSRPFCWKCKLHCMHPLMLKIHGESDLYCCSFRCTTFFTTTLSLTV